MTRYWISERLPGVTHHAVVPRRGGGVNQWIPALWTDCGKPLRRGADGLPTTGQFISVDKAAELGTVPCGQCRFETRREVA